MQSQVRFNGFRRRFRRRPGSLVQRKFRRRSGRFNRVLEKLPEKVPGSLGAKPSQVQHGSGEGSGEGRGEGSGEGLGGFGAEPGQVQQGSGEGSGEGLGGFGASVCFQCLPSQHASERFIKIQRCGCWGYHRSLLQVEHLLVSFISISY